MSRAFAVLTVSLALVATRGAAQEDEASIRQSAAARELFTAGVVCADAADWPCAIDRFQRAYELRASPVIAWNLGHALVEGGRLVEAAEMLRRVERDESADAPVRRDARAALDAIVPLLGTLTVHLEGPTDGVRVFVGELELPPALLEMEAPIDPGTHEISARRDGDSVATTSMEITPGAYRSLTLRIPARPETRQEAPPDLIIAPSSASDESGLMIGLGVGGAVLAVGMAIVLIVVLAPPSEPSPFQGTLGFVEIGR